VKRRINASQEFVIGGYIPSHLGVDSIVIGFYRDKQLRYAARVRAGFVPLTRRQVFERIKTLETGKCPFVNLPEKEAGRWGQGLTAEKMTECSWVKPRVADYISDRIAQSINNSLARLPGLKVIPNSVALRYKGKAADFQKIGEDLGVKTVLSGRVLQRGNDLSIDIELDDVRNGKQLWGQQYARTVADLLMVQNDIAREVSQRLRSQLSAADRQKLTLGSTFNPDAYQLYLKGTYYTSKFTKDGFDKGIDYLNRAIALDPNYAQAYSALASNYINQDDWFIARREAAP
jgi:TolB-like protein